MTDDSYGELNGKKNKVSTVNGPFNSLLSIPDGRKIPDFAPSMSALLDRNCDFSKREQARNLIGYSLT